MNVPSPATPTGRARPERGFTLTEMLATVCVLVILLGMMVSLARYVRERSAQELTRDLLVRLDAVMARYRQRNQGQLPPVPVLAPEVDEPAVQRYAAANNLQFVRAIRTQLGTSDSALAALPLYVYDERSIRDTWGSPVLFLPRQHPAVGMAPGDRFFFVSAGPDREFLTRDDNLYSYEAATIDSDVLADSSGLGGDATALPAGHGQGE